MKQVFGKLRMAMADVPARVPEAAWVDQGLYFQGQGHRAEPQHRIAAPIRGSAAGVVGAACSSSEGPRSGSGIQDQWCLELVGARQGVPRAAEGNEQEDKAEEGNGDGNAADGRAGEKNNDSSKRAGARSEPAAKRTSGQQRALPDGAVVTPIAKDGNCLFESIAQGLCGLEPRCELASTLEERGGLW